MKHQYKSIFVDTEPEYLEMEQKHMSKATTKASVVKHKPVTKKSTKKVTKPKIELKNRIKNVKKVVIVQFNNIKKRLGVKSKKAKKVTKAERKLAHSQKIHGIIGIGLLFVVVSIAYSTYMTVLFVDGATMAMALTPQVVFASAMLLIAFYKIYK